MNQDPRPDSPPDPRVGDHALDVPFEAQPAAHVDLTEAVVAGGVVVMAASLPVEGVGEVPALVFRFSTPTGRFLPPVVLVADADQLGKVGPLIGAAADVAIDHARARQ